MQPRGNGAQNLVDAACGGRRVDEAAHGTTLIVDATEHHIVHAGAHQRDYVARRDSFRRAVPDDRYGRPQLRQFPHQRQTIAAPGIGGAQHGGRRPRARRGKHLFRGARALHGDDTGARPHRTLEPRARVVVADQDQNPRSRWVSTRGSTTVLVGRESLVRR